MVAKTFKGLEEVLRDELIALGAQNVEIGQRMVSFEGGLEMLYKANLCCRTALRILKPIVKFTASNPDELYDEVRDIEWEKYMGVDSTFSIDSTVNSADFTHSKFVTYRVKDGIADHFTDLYGRRPSIRLTGADLMLNVHIFENRVTISLDSSGEPLNQRGYRIESTKAPLNEVLAAGIIMKTGWRGDSNFVDPMCGSGTFLVEAALIAANINPGIYRDSFAFERWDNFDRELFESLYNDDSGEREFKFRIFGGDIDPEAVAIARANIKRARVDGMVELVCKPFEEWETAPESGILITNPPYGERLKSDDILDMYRRIGTELKQVFKGYHAWILGYEDEHFTSIGLKPSVKFPILNGALECSLREYVLFDGKYNEFKAEGGSVRNEEFDRGDRTKVKHLSDREWERETRKFSDNKDRGERPERKRFERRRDDDRKDFRRDDRKDFRRDDRKDFRRDDRKDFRRDDRKDFRRDDRKDFRRDDRKDFRRDDRKDFRRDDRKDFRRDDRRDDRKDFRREYKPRFGDGRQETEQRHKAPRRDETGTYKIFNNGPTLPESSATVFSAVPIRSRRSFLQKIRDKHAGENEIKEQEG